MIEYNVVVRTLSIFYFVFCCYQLFIHEWVVCFNLRLFCRCIFSVNINIYGNLERGTTYLTDRSNLRSLEAILVNLKIGRMQLYIYLKEVGYELLSNRHTFAVCSPLSCVCTIIYRSLVQLVVTVALNDV